MDETNKKSQVNNQEIDKEKPLADKTKNSQPIEPQNQIKVPLMIGGTVVVVGIAAASIATLTNRQNIPASNPTEIPDDKAQQEILEAVNFRDGVYYTETEFYVDVADKTHIIGVTITIENKEIKDVEVVEVNKKGEKVENEHMTEFDEKLENIIKGKEINEIYNMDLVAKSTLTSDAFKEALKQIEENAQEGVDKQSSLLADGEYIAEKTFYVPEAQKTHTISVKIEIKSGKITQAHIKEVDKEGNDIENKYMDEFTTKVNKEIKGKEIDEIYEEDLVSGSTLTADAFKNALAKIEEKNS